MLDPEALEVREVREFRPRGRTTFFPTVPRDSSLEGNSWAKPRPETQGLRESFGNSAGHSVWVMGLPKHFPYERL